MKLRVKSLEFRVKKFLLHCAVILFVFSLQPSTLSAAEWSGVDETVVEKYAKEHGREAREPLINTDQGDLLLFVFLLAGTAGGFTAGYYWRTLMENRTREKNTSRGNS
jgi:hypothetical protein